jgi:DNA primase
MLNTAELKQRVNLKDIVEQDLGRPARKSAKAWQWLCPFHGDRNTPSLAVYEDHAHCYGCGWNGDVIKWIQERRGLDFKAACEYLGAEIVQGPVVRHSPASSPMKEPPAERWQGAALEVVMECAAILQTEAGAKARHYLEARGISAETVAHWNIGFNPVDRKVNELWIPRGITIPGWHESANTLWYLKVRRAAGEPRYINVKGSVFGMYGADTLAGHDTAFVCEGEFDTLLLWQHIRDRAGVVTMGGAGNKDVDSWLPYLLPLRRLFIATDADQPGEEAATYWLGKTARARRVLPPKGKDITDSWLAGADLRQWALEQLGE